MKAILDGYKRLLFPSLEREKRTQLSEVAHEQAIDVFACNIEQLLLTPPLKNRVILGFDPAFRTGCKLAVIDKNGDFIYKDIIYPHEFRKGEEVNIQRLKASKDRMVRIINDFKVRN